MNPERLLGHLIKSGLRQGGGMAKGLNMGGKAGLGMGALGLAFAAYEHFTDPTRAAAPPVPPPNSPAPSPSTAVAPDSVGPPPVPPPLPAATTSASGAPANNESNPSLSAEDSVLLIRAMIAAANADGFIDKDEEERIMSSARDSHFDAEDLEFLESEIHKPRSLFEIALEATSPELAQQVYAASVLVLKVDSEAELTYLRQLASAMHLTDDDVKLIHSQLDKPSE